ncbi:MAG: hypothetical protein HY833_00195 [Candidatus Aenigmarchaeota archaeon]|nr:hypothetical protein [Candidatus Aenigmarchaeota archaeon]
MPLLGTRNFVLNVVGDFAPENVRVIVKPEHKLPEEIAANVYSNWMKTLEDKAKTFTGDVKIDTDYKPMPRLLVDGRPKMFAGPLMRIDNYQVRNGKFTIEGSPTNYAASMATQNTDPYGIIDKHGMSGLANSCALSATPIFKNKDGEDVIQTFGRMNLGEYPFYTGTAAGNVSVVREDAVSRTAYSEISEETGLVPRVEFPDDLKKLGLVKESSDIEKMRFSNGLYGVVIKDRDKNGNVVSERKAITYNEKPSIQGMVLNVDIEDYTKDNAIKPHFKHEFMVYQPTGIDVDTYESMELWKRAEEKEHASVNYVRATMDGVKEFLFDTQTMPNRAMPVTQAVVLYSVKKRHGIEGIRNLIGELNEKFPIGDDHPLYSRTDAIRKGGYDIGTFVQ